ncbi:hypothetical protein [Listeria sp. PSOL-1]|uniref:hypothetical protein n=1 Tax=Listeria sp. PSOL-1 TaxID=1844999 RepID=UPI0013D10F0A|nr:hypothetical protein [Listeria sp. PSOL-1]
MNKNEQDLNMNYAQRICFLILAFILPVFGIIFSVLIIRNSTKAHWIKVVAIVALILQSLGLILSLLGYLTFYFGTPELS